MNGTIKLSHYLYIIILLCVISGSLTNAQTQRWIYQFNGQNNSGDFASSIAYGLDGNIYVGGSSKNDGTGSDDLTVVSLDQRGQERWAYLHHTPGSTSNVAISIVCGNDGNIYIAGYTHCSGIFDDLLVISLNPSGNERWIYRSDSLVGSWESASKIICGLDGNLYIAGGIGNLWNRRDPCILSLDTDGHERWLYRLSSPENAMNYFEDLTFGSDGRIYSCGRIYKQETSDDMIVMCLDQNGAEQWTYYLNGQANDVDRAHSIAYGLDGNIYIAGEIFDDLNHDCDFFIASLTASGQERWSYSYNGPANLWDAAHDMTYGANGDIYAVGITMTMAGMEDVITICLDPNGSEKWIYTYNGPLPRNNDHGDNICYGQDNNIYISGCSDQMGYTQNAEWLVASTDTNGVERWAYRYHGSLIANDRIQSMCYGADGNLYCAGSISDSLTRHDLAVISLNPLTMIEERQVKNFGVRTGATIISGPLVLPEGKKCKVFDITGRTVLPADLRSGIYFIEIDGKISQKVVKIR